MTTSAAFDRGASRYDLLVGLNPGYHTELRKAGRALASLVADPMPLRLVDLACGTGASTAALMRAAPSGSSVVGVDASEGMLRRARRKDWPAGVRFLRGVCGDLDLDAIGRVRDGVLACYLFRNLPPSHRDRALAEAFAMLRPGGWLVVQEYAVAGDRRARGVWDAVSLGVIVPLGVVLDGNANLYRYLWRSVREFESVSAFADRLVAAGFTDVAHRTASGWQRGILHTFAARRPAEDA